MMYTILRKIHLYSGLVLLLFVLMYFLTGFVMTHDQWFPRGKPTRTTTEHPLHYSGPWTADDLGAFLSSEFSIPGRVQQVTHHGDDAWSFVYATAGQENKVVVSAAQDKVSINRTDQTAVGVMHRLHRFHGYVADGSTTSGRLSTT